MVFSDFYIPPLPQKMLGVDLNGTWNVTIRLNVLKNYKFRTNIDGFRLFLYVTSPRDDRGAFQ